MFSNHSPRKGHMMSIVLILVLLFSSLAPLGVGPARAQDAPVLRLPLNGALTTIANFPPLGIPQVSWSPVSGATLYRVQFSQDIGFASIPLNITTANTSYTPLTVTTSLFTDGTWYWRVRVERPSAGEYSEVRSFNKQWGSESNAPALTNPTGGAALDFYNHPTFSWQPVVGAASYRFQIASSDTGFSSPVYSAASVLTTSHQPLLKLANGVYYWQVTPLDPGGNAGRASQVRSFIMSYGVDAFYAIEAPTLIEPGDETFPVFTPTFRWSAVPGAQTYRLEYTSAPNCNFVGAPSIETRNTTYTPTLNFPNDQNYCWRVRAQSGSSVSEWSDTWEFTKKWYIQPVLLTPVNNYQYTYIPYFSWTPVPGASRYQIEVNTVNSFPVTSASVTACRFTDSTSSNTHFFHFKNPVCVPAPGVDYFWRVTPIDKNGNFGLPSEVKSFRGGENAPQLIYPLYYYEYPPASYPSDAALNPLEDRSIPFPLFMWHRQMDLLIEEQAPAYRLEVSQGDPYFTPPVWTFETENLSAVPLFGAFSPQPTPTDYYWRVKSDWDDGRVEPWSQIWRTRIDPSKMLPATTAITPLRPAQGYEFAETAPLLEWYTLQGAASYEVQISIDPSFDTPYLVPTSGAETMVRVSYPAYTPLKQLDYYPQDNNSNLPYGTYYWRVRGLGTGGSAIGTWSTPWRFQIVAQSSWRPSRTIGALPTEPDRLIGYSPNNDADDEFELSTLYSAQSGSLNNSFWYFGFRVPSTSADIAYVLYLDLDHQENSGATTDAKGYAVNTISAHRPEYAIYILPNGSEFLASEVQIYPWESGAWGFRSLLSDISGELSYDSGSQYLEIKVPDTAIGMMDTTSSASIALFSVDRSQNPVIVKDTVPVGNRSTLNRFAGISGKLTLAMPANNITGDPTKLPSVLPFSWHLPVNVPWYGFRVQVGVDPSLTNWNYDLTVYGSSIAFPEFTYSKDFDGDNTYYWRVRPLYYAPGAPNNYVAGAWSDVGRFERDGFVPQNLKTIPEPDPADPIQIGTPIFAWDRVEGAESYDLQVSSNSTFSALQFGTINTTQNTYTPVSTLANGTYYWRVRANRNGGVSNDWTTAQVFQLSLPTPGGLHTIPDTTGFVQYAPTMCWDPLLYEYEGYPIFSAWKYRLEVSTTANFSTVSERIDTEQACYTPAKGYPDGAFYWRVAMIDGNGRLGPFSSVESFTKQYPMPQLVSPTPGSLLPTTPTFVWTPVQGAARYKIEIANNPNFSPVFETITTVNTSYSSIKLYPPDTGYYWRVAMIDKDGIQGPFTGSATPGDAIKSFIPMLLR